MAVRDNQTKAANINGKIREVDFVSAFAKRWTSLLNIMGVSRAIEQTPGSQLESLRASVSLQNAPAEGDETELSLASLVKVPLGTINLERYETSVTTEAIQKYGYAQACGKTDEAFLTKLIGKVVTKYFNALKTGTMTCVEGTFQMALAMAKAYVNDNLKKLNRVSLGTVGFVNVLDYGKYVGGATITTQNAEGIEYVQNFLGYNVVFLCSSDEIPQNTVIATPIENIVCYFCNPANADFASADLNYTTDAETGYVGIHVEGNYGRGASDVHALMGLDIFPEILDCVGIATIDSGSTLGTLTGVSTAAGTAAAGDSVVTLPTSGIDNSAVFYIKAQASTAPAAPTYKEKFNTSGYTKVKNGDTISTTNGHKYRVVEVNGAGQAIASADGTITAKA